MQETGAGNHARFRAIVIDELGDVPEQSLDRQPDARLEAGIEGGVLLLESALAATFSSHGDTVICAAAPSIPPRAGCQKEPMHRRSTPPLPDSGVRAHHDQ